MTFRFPLSAPRREDATILPAILAGLLVLMLASQLAFPSDIASQPVLASSRATRIAGVDAAPIRAADIIVARNLFAPGRSQTGALGKVPGTALGGAVVAGTVGSGARMRAVVMQPGGTLVFVGVGGLLNDWRLDRLRPDRAVFRRGADKLEMPFGGMAPSAPDAGERTDQ